MTIQQELADELKDAIKKGDTLRRDAIRQVQTEVSTARSSTDHRGEADDALYKKVIASYVKKMDKTRAEYEELGDRGRAMAEKLAFEVEYLSRWLPSKLDDEETRRIVIETIEELGVRGEEKAAGKVIGRIMKSRADDLDGALVSRLVREELTRG